MIIKTSDDDSVRNATVLTSVTGPVIYGRKTRWISLPFHFDNILDDRDQNEEKRGKRCWKWKKHSHRPVYASMFFSRLMDSWSQSAIRAVTVSRSESTLAGLYGSRIFDSKTCNLKIWRKKQTRNGLYLNSSQTPTEHSNKLKKNKQCEKKPFVYLSLRSSSNNAILFRKLLDRSVGPVNNNKHNFCTTTWFWIEWQMIYSKSPEMKFKSKNW